MKVIKLSLVIMAAALLTIGLSGMAYSHDGGVSHCDSCHTMHNSSAGVVMTISGSTTVGQTNAYLLKGATQSDTCLNCHISGSASSFHVATSGTVMPVQLTPGGDFSWLLYGSSTTKNRRGHSIIAPAYGFSQDTTFTNGAPGGGTGSASGYSTANLHCSSCHDPHGKYRITDITAAYTTQVTTGAVISQSGSTPSKVTTIPAGTAVGTYRLLAGVNYKPKSYQDFPFVSAAPVALAPNTYNRSEISSDTRVAYGKGMSEWCANCHGAFHNDSYPSTLRHPSGNDAKLTSVEVANYNAYVKTGDLSGNISTAYTSLVPFEEGNDNLNTLKADAVFDGSIKTGASTSNNVACLTCHRAHASGFTSMTRWDTSKTFLVDSTGAYSIPSGSGYVASDLQQAMYGRPPTAFPNFQRSLCNKCHVKD